MSVDDLGHVPVRDTTLAAERIGATGPDLIWGHGLSQSRAAEATVGLIDWPRVPARVVRYDARGHGESPTTPDPRAYGWDQLAQDQLALADALGIDKYIAAGASMGCGTAIHVATHAPERITRLVLVIPPTAWETRTAQADEWDRAATVIETQGVEPMIAARAELAPPQPFLEDPEYRTRQAEALRAWDPARLAQVMRGAKYADLPPRDAVAEIRLPTLILAWAGDPVHPLSTATELAELIPDAELYIAETAPQLATWTARIAAFVSG